MFRTATAQKHSSFMLVSLMNERSPFSLTSGKMVHSFGCFIDISNTSQRKNKVSVRAVKREENIHASSPHQRWTESMQPSGMRDNVDKKEYI